MMSSTNTSHFRTLPRTAKVQPKDFQVHVPEEKLAELYFLLEHSKIGRDTYEGRQPNRQYGISSTWLGQAKEAWKSFDWRQTEEEINTFPNYTLPIKDNDVIFDIHFIALFSEREDAVPLMMLHGWPGSFLEFIPIIEILMEMYTPSTLPYHVVIPSLPGYAFSSPPPLDRDFRLEDVARIMNSLMIELGFGASGYVVQGGDLGSKVARVLGGEHKEAKAIHFNFCIMADPGTIDESGYNELEKRGLERKEGFHRHGIAFAIEQATKPSTLGLVLATNPLALLAWIGEKFLDWTDNDPPLDDILESVTLYWLTECMSTAMYPYRQIFTPGHIGAHENPDWHLNKPMGFSWFPYEIAPVPRAWAATTGDLVFYRQHKSGGHFAAIEQPDVLLKDVEDFIAQVWPVA